MERRHAGKADIKEWNEQIKQDYGIADFFDRKEKIQVEDGKYLIREHEKIFFFEEEKIIPTLQLLQKQNILKKITVDMGAVKFVVNGADIMRPGIVAIDEGISKDSYVVIVDQNNKKPIAVGKMLFSGEEVLAMKTGKVIKNVHWIGDEIWKR